MLMALAAYSAATRSALCLLCVEHITLHSVSSTQLPCRHSVGRHHVMLVYTVVDLLNKLN